MEGITEKSDDEKYAEKEIFTKLKFMFEPAYNHPAVHADGTICPWTYELFGGKKKP